MSEQELDTADFRARCDKRQNRCEHRAAGSVLRCLFCAEQVGAALLAEHERLRIWQGNVTVAVGDPGGTFYKDVPEKVRELAKAGAHMIALRKCMDFTCMCGDVFPSVQEFHEHVDLVHGDSDKEPA